VQWRVPWWCSIDGPDALAFFITEFTEEKQRATEKDTFLGTYTRPVVRCVVRCL